MEVLGYDPYLSVNAAWNLNREVKHVLNVEEIYAESDFITIHVPLLDSTKGMINKDSIAKMKNGVKILNFARGELVDDDALEEALESGKIAKYVTDFADSRVAAMKNTVVTPHLGASTQESEDNCAIMAVQQLQDYLDDGNIIHSVNYPDLDAGVCKTESRIACLHKNIPNMLGQITKVMGEEHVNIANLYNKSREKWAYTLVDLDTRVTDGALEKLNAIEGMCRVRIVK